MNILSYPGDFTNETIPRLIYILFLIISSVYILHLKSILFKLFLSGLWIILSLNFFLGGFNLSDKDLGLANFSDSIILDTTYLKSRFPFEKGNILSVFPFKFIIDIFNSLSDF